MHETTSQETKEDFKETYQQLTTVCLYLQRLQSLMNMAYKNIEAANELKKVKLRYLVFSNRASHHLLHIPNLGKIHKIIEGRG